MLFCSNKDMHNLTLSLLKTVAVGLYGAEPLFCLIQYFEAGNSQAVLSVL